MYSETLNGFHISPYMQEMTYAAQGNCYEKSAHALKQYLLVEVNALQIHRVANAYGAKLEKEKISMQVESAKQVEGNNIDRGKI